MPPPSSPAKSARARPARRSALRGPRSTVIAKSRIVPARRSRGPRRREPSRPRSGGPFSTSCTPSGSSIRLPPKSTPHCSTKAAIFVRFARCTAFWTRAQEVRERRDQLRHPQYHKPELLATGPNQVWSWDITKLLGPAKWSYFYLYVILDIFSRYVVGWTLAQRESGQLAQRLIRETCAKEDIEEGRLTIHADRGTSMTSQTVAQLLAALGVVKSHSRPQVSNDNPFSESQFKTLKYRPEFPRRFASYDHALTFCREFFPWYNQEHRHWGLGLLTPATVHSGHAAEALAARQKTLSTAYAATPERFVRREPRPLRLPEAVWINPPAAPTKSPENPLPALH